MNPAVSFRVGVCKIIQFFQIFYENVFYHLIVIFILKNIIILKKRASFHYAIRIYWLFFPQLQ